MGKIGARFLLPGLSVSRQLHDGPYARKPQSRFLGWAEVGVDSSNEAEKLMGSVGQRSLRGDNPASSGELPHPIGVEIATAGVYPRTIVRHDVGISIAEVVFRRRTEGGGVMIRSIYPGMCA